MLHEIYRSEGCVLFYPFCRRTSEIFKFIWRDQLYAFTSLPMGLTSTPRIFTKVLKPVFSCLRSQFGHTCLGYIDDSFYLEDSYTECEEATLRAIQLFVSLGFKIHPEKSVIIPTQILEFLEFIWSVGITLVASGLSQRPPGT